MSDAIIGGSSAYESAIRKIRECGSGVPVGVSYDPGFTPEEKEAYSKARGAQKRFKANGQFLLPPLNPIELLSAPRYPTAIIVTQSDGSFAVVTRGQPDQHIGVFRKWADAEFFRLAVTGELLGGFAAYIANSLQRERENAASE